jgi:hypothetical protein
VLEFHQWRMSATERTPVSTRRGFHRSTEFIVLFGQRGDAETLSAV